MDFIISIVVVLIVVGVLLWAVSAMPWIDADFKQVIRIIIVVATALYLLGALTGYAPIPLRR
jgi:hypothetical protein